MLGLNKDNAELVDFICSQQGEELFKTIVFLYTWKVEIFFYDNFNTNDSFYDFLLAQQDEIKKIINKKISYARGFKQYLQNFLQNFDYEDVKKFDLFTNKISKYIFYRFNFYLELTHRQKKKKKKKKIRHSKKLEDIVGLKKVQKKIGNI